MGRPWREGNNTEGPWAGCTSCVFCRTTTGWLIHKSVTSRSKCQAVFIACQKGKKKTNYSLLIFITSCTKSRSKRRLSIKSVSTRAHWKMYISGISISQRDLVEMPLLPPKKRKKKISHQTHYYFPTWVPFSFGNMTDEEEIGSLTNQRLPATGPHLPSGQTLCLLKDSLNCPHHWHSRLESQMFPNPNRQSGSRIPIAFVLSLADLCSATETS